MHHPILAGPRRRTRRALLAAALPAALAAAALPSAAQAATAHVINSGPNGVLGYEAADGETNQVFVRVNGNKLVISDNTAPITARDGCSLDAFGRAECPLTVDSIILVLRDKNDRVEYAAPHQASISGEDGNDLFLGGLRQTAAGRPIEPAFYFGGRGQDTISYRFADRGVRVDTDDIPGSIPADDGRPGIDLDSLGDDVEIIEGSNFDDPQLFGSDANNVLRGLDGNDVIGGGEGSDSIDEGPAPNGADFINGGNGATDAVNYASRQTGGVNVSLDGLRNDGAVGEQDDVRPSVEQVIGTSFRDVLSGNGLANTLVGVSGNDTIDGSRGDDTLFAGPASDGITAGAGNDVIFARNGSIDNVDCGDNTDTDALERDTSENRVEGCERVEVGVLRLAPQGIRAEAGETAQLRLSWRHPQNWRKLRKVELRLTRDRVPVGEITIRPRAERISDRGDVELVRKRTGLTHKGKTVTARLAIRLDDSLADQELTADVEATDTRGRRQLEHDAGTVRVAE